MRMVNYAFVIKLVVVIRIFMDNLLLIYWNQIHHLFFTPDHGINQNTTQIGILSITSYANQML